MKLLFVVLFEVVCFATISSATRCLQGVVLESEAVNHREVNEIDCPDESSFCIREDTTGTIFFSVAGTTVVYGCASLATCEAECGITTRLVNAGGVSLARQDYNLIDCQRSCCIAELCNNNSLSNFPPFNPPPTTGASTSPPSMVASTPSATSGGEGGDEDQTNAPAETTTPVETDAPAETMTPAETNATAKTMTPAETDVPAETMTPSVAEIRPTTMTTTSRAADVLQVERLFVLFLSSSSLLMTWL